MGNEYKTQTSQEAKIMKKKQFDNYHLTAAFNEILPEIEKACIKYWVYAGVGLAGIVGRFYRINDDIDIYVLYKDFSKVEKILKKLCKKHGASDGDNWTMRYSITKRTSRPKLDIFIKEKELFSVIPVYVTKRGVEFKVYESFLLPPGALEQKPKKINKFRFYSAPQDTILYLFRILLKQYVINCQSSEPASEKWKYVVDARTVLPKKEVQQFVTQYNMSTRKIAAREKLTKAGIYLYPNRWISRLKRLIHWF